MKTLLVITFCLLTLGAFAQKNEGTIQYKETVKFEINLDAMKDLPEEMKKLIPNEQSFENTLYFNHTASLYTNAESSDATNDVEYKSDNEDVDIQIKMDSPERSYYKDLKTKDVVESQDLFGKKFLITGKREKMKWKMSAETKDILGYTCKKASSTTEDGKTVDAWFTTAIPIAIGPGGFNELPGAILAIAIDGEKHTVTATKINLEKVDAKKIEKPKKGKKVTNEEFKKIVTEKQKEMAEMYGGDGGQIIIKTEVDE